MTSEHDLPGGPNLRNGKEEVSSVVHLRACGFKRGVRDVRLRQGQRSKKGAQAQGFQFQE
jgi:hypothetical protein